MVRPGAIRATLVAIVGAAAIQVGCATANATPSSFQLRQYFPAAASCSPDGSCTIAGSVPVDQTPYATYRGLLATEIGGKTIALVMAPLPPNASPTDPWVGFSRQDCQSGIGTRCQANMGMAMPPVSNISCQSALNCTAVGSYRDGAGNVDGVLLTETNGVWANGAQAQLPASLTNPPAPDNTELRFVSVQCVSAGNCTAVANVDTYTFTGPWFPNNGVWMQAGSDTAVAFTETDGTWSTGEVLQPPADVNAGGFTEITSLSCPAAGDCVAVGRYSSSSRAGPGFVVTESNGSWAHGIDIAAPPNPDAILGIELDAVACTQVGECTAVGGATLRNSNTQYTEPLAVSESGGTWSTATILNAPANALPIADAQLAEGDGLQTVLDMVACPAAGSCVAAGNYVDANGIPQAMFVNQSNGAWPDGVEAQLPADSGNFNSMYITALSCAAPGDCAAAGKDQEIVLQGPGSIGGAPGDGLLLSESDGTWTPGSLPELAGAAQGGTEMGTVSCAAPSTCAAIGDYVSSADVVIASAGAQAAAASAAVPFVVQHAATGWGQATELTLPAATRAQILASIRPLLVADRRGAAAARGHKRFTVAVRSFTAPEAGKITVRWVAKAGVRSIVVAQASATTGKPGTIKLRIRVTNAGRALLASRRTVRVTDQATFTPTGTTGVHASDSFVLAG